MSVKTKRSDLQEIVIGSDNDPETSAKLVVKLAKPREVYSDVPGYQEYNTNCIQFQIKGNWKSKHLHITKESARKLIPLLQELMEERSS